MRTTRRRPDALLRALVAALPRCAFDFDEAAHARGLMCPTGMGCGALASHRVDQCWYCCPRHHALMTARTTRGQFEALAWYAVAREASA
jgi:hypothetical protein